MSSESLESALSERRADAGFRDRLQESMERDRTLLDRLAQPQLEEGWEEVLRVRLWGKDYLWIRNTKTTNTRRQLRLIKRPS